MTSKLQDLKDCSKDQLISYIQQLELSYDEQRIRANSYLDKFQSKEFFLKAREQFLERRIKELEEENLRLYTLLCAYEGETSTVFDYRDGKAVLVYN